MPNHWRSTRGRTAPKVDEDTSTGQIEQSRRPPQTTQGAEAAANATVALQDIDKARSKRSFSRTRTDFERPKTAGGSTQPTSDTVERPPRGSSRAYAAETHKPLVQCLDLKTAYCMDEDMIGMALGSPSHPPFVQSNPHDHLPALTANAGVHAHPTVMVDAKSTNLKAGKWKKLGGLFKPKHNTSIQVAKAIPATSQPQNAGQVVDGTDLKPQPLPKDTPKIGQVMVHSEPTPTVDPSVEDVEDSTATIIRTELPKLDVDFPDVQLDRYSVMFGTLLSGHQSTTLLARRSKVLEKLKTTCDENVASQDPLAQQEQQDVAVLHPRAAEPNENEQLKPPPSSRRATSPTPGKSPVFSLFPQPPTTPRRAVAMISQAKPNPLQRSYTAPSRLSPMEEIFGTKKPLAVKPNYTKRRKSSISPVETSASTAQGPGWSTDGSHLSPTSSVSSVDDEILFDIKKLSMVTENQEPQYEVTKPDGETVELYRARSLKNRAAKPPALKLSSNFPTAETAEPSAPKANEPGLTSFDVVARSTSEVLNNVATTTKSLNVEYLLPSTHFIPTTHVATRKEKSAPVPKNVMTRAAIPPSEVKGRPIPDMSQGMEPVVESPVESPVDIDESTEASQDILAAAVMGTLDHMGEQSSLRAASPMPESPGLRVPTPEKPVKLLAIPKNIPISKYSLRSPADPHTRTDPISRSGSPQPRRTRTEPPMHDQSFAALATMQQEPPAAPNSRGKKITPKPNSSSKIVPPPPKGDSKIKGPKPELSIVAPTPTTTIDTSSSTLSPIEVTVARQVSLSRKQSKRLLIPPPGKRLEGLDEEKGEKVVNSQALMPVFVDANKAHRPGKSLAVSIVNI